MIKAASENGKALTLVCLLTLGYVPLLTLHFWQLWRQPQYQYFPFVAAAAVFLTWNRIGTSSTEERQELGSKIDLYLGLSFAWITLAIATFLLSPWFAMFSFIFLLGIAIRYIKRAYGLTNAFGIWLTLWLLLPLPLTYDQKLVQWLQSLSSQFSSQWLDMCGVLHVMSGNVLRTADKQFFVDEACSGIISVMSIIACATILSVYKNRAYLHFVLNVVMAPAWAMTMNIGRITLIGISHYYFGWDLSTGLAHDLLGLALFLCTFGLLVSADCATEVALAHIEWHQVLDRPGVLVRGFNRLVSVGDPRKALEE